MIELSDACGGWRGECARFRDALLPVKQRIAAQLAGELAAGLPLQPKFLKIPKMMPFTSTFQSF